ncbi:MAG: PilZ domain-containing protein [Alphaproteobacteria bacterium]|nr:PilZ domain-containing protein [Alphaproteobacteria bacterium]
MSDRTQAKPQDAQAQEQDGKERRRFPRSTVVWSGRLLFAGGSADCVVLNISINGAKVQLSGGYTGPEDVVLEIARFGQFRGQVAWRSGNSVGVTFDEEPDRVAAVIGAAVPGTRLEES